MAKSKLVQVNEKIADAVVGGYKKIENGVVGAYRKVEDGFVDKFLTREGESVEDAEKRLAEEQAKREAESKEAAEKRATATPTGVHSGSDAGKASLERSLEIARTSVEASQNAGK